MYRNITENSRRLRGIWEDRWKMASEWCTEHRRKILCKAATGTACYSGRVYVALDEVCSVRNG